MRAYALWRGHDSRGDDPRPAEPPRAEQRSHRRDASTLCGLWRRPTSISREVSCHGPSAEQALEGVQDGEQKGCGQKGVPRAEGVPLDADASESRCESDTDGTCLACQD